MSPPGRKRPPPPSATPPDAGLHPPGAAIHLTVSCPANDYLLLAYGRLSAERALATGRISLSGDPTLLRRFEEWMQGF